MHGRDEGDSAPTYCELEQNWEIEKHSMSRARPFFLFLFLFFFFFFFFFFSFFLFFFKKKKRKSLFFLLGQGGS